MLHRLDHYNIKTVLPEETIDFYCGVLGCVEAPERRPANLPPGTWLLVDDHPAIHIMFVDRDRAAPTGAIDHIAFEASGYSELCDRLTDLGVEFKTVETPESDLLQIFVMDPNQIRVEINICGEGGESG